MYKVDGILLKKSPCGYILYCLKNCFIPLSGVYLQLFLSCYISPCNVARMSFNYHMFEIDIKVITKWYIVLVTHGKIASNVVLHLDIIMK